MLTPSEALVAVFISSLLGSLHCVGMCGSLVALCCVGQPNNKTNLRLAYAELAYHLMRLVSYTTLGIIAGFFGNITNNLTQAAGFQQVFGIAAGALLIFWGAIELGVIRKIKGLSGLQNIVSIKIASASIFKKPLAFTGTARGAFIGLLSGILPCGWLYAYVLAAAATANPISGGVLMAVFWLGTIPSLVIFARVVKKLDSTLLNKIPKITAVIVIGLGIMAISGKLNIQQSINPQNSSSSATELTCH